LTGLSRVDYDNFRLSKKIIEQRHGERKIALKYFNAHPLQLFLTVTDCEKSIS